MVLQQCWLHTIMAAEKFLPPGDIKASSCSPAQPMPHLFMAMPHGVCNYAQGAMLGNEWFVRPSDYYSVLRIVSLEHTPATAFKVSLL